MQTHEQLDGPLTDEHHAYLITLIEKRLPPDSQLRADYLIAKKSRKAGVQETWELAMRHLHHSCINDVDEEERKLWRPLQGLPLPPRVSSPH